MTQQPTQWHDAANAQAYADFTRRFPMYAETSRDLVDRIEPATAGRVIDLCSGTGATTRELLDRLGNRAQVWAVDGSAEMIAVAKTETIDPRVSWICSPAEEVDLRLPAAARPVDAVVCNSAIWQTDLPATFAAVAELLRPDGCFAFNLSSRFVQLPGQDRQAPPPATTHLGDLMRQAAIREFGYRASEQRMRRRSPQTPESIASLLEQAGLRQVSAEVLEYRDSPELVRAWLEVPIFADTVCPGLPYEQQREALRIAAEQVDPAPADPARWYVVVASPDGSRREA